MQEEIKSAENVQHKAERGERNNIVTLKRPYTFESKEYTEIDLGGLENMTIQDAIDTQIDLFGQQEVASSLLCETTSAFAMAIAAKATGLPIEFFKLMPIGAGRKVKRMVQGHIGKSGNEGTVMRLKKPYCFKGETYKEFNFAPVADINMMQESAAENAMTMEGVIITENSFNYLYACAIAGMALEQPKELFTGLPLSELLNLKEAVNNSDFFE